MFSAKVKLLIFLFVIAVFALILPRYSAAEIATTRDWIGLFAQSAGDTKGEALPTTPNAVFPDGHAWLYNSTCSQADPGADAVPKVSSGASPCNFAPNPLPETGLYEYRMYANDKEEPDALLARSSSLRPSPTPMPSGPVVNCPVQETNPRVDKGLISTPSISNNFGNRTGTCMISDKATFAPFKIPSYVDLESLFYTQSKTPKSDSDATGEDGLSTALGTQDSIVRLSGNLGMNGNVTASGTHIVFVKGNLTFASPMTSFTYGGDGKSGLVFIVKGDVIIEPSVRKIDAVIIAAGTIYTAGSGCSNTSPVLTEQLVINGSLINLDPSKPIKFCRKLATNEEAAEKINHEPKYLVILRNLLSETLQKWSEVQ